MTQRSLFLPAALFLTTLAGAGCQPPTVEAHIEPSGASLRTSPYDADDKVEPGRLTVQGTATLDVTPDVADVRMDVTSFARTPTAAVAELRQHEKAMCAKLSAQGVDESDIRVSTITVNPRTERINDRYVVTGYDASLNVTASTTEFDTVPAIIEASTEAGVTSVYTNFRSTKLPELKAKVRQMALDAAIAKREQFKESLGLQLGRVVNVSESTLGDGWAFGNVTANAVGTVASGGGYLQPTTTAMTLTVDISYELA